MSTLAAVWPPRAQINRRRHFTNPANDAADVIIPVGLGIMGAPYAAYQLSGGPSGSYVSGVAISPAFPFDAFESLDLGGIVFENGSSAPDALPYPVLFVWLVSAIGGVSTLNLDSDTWPLTATLLERNRTTVYHTPQELGPLNARHDYETQLPMPICFSRWTRYFTLSIPADILVPALLQYTDIGRDVFLILASSGEPGAQMQSVYFDSVQANFRHPVTLGERSLGYLRVVP